MFTVINLSPKSLSYILFLQFDIVRINCNSCCLVPEKLPEFNQLEIQFQLKDVKATAMLVAQVREIVQNTFCQR